MDADTPTARALRAAREEWTKPYRDALDALVAAADGARARSWVDVDTTRVFVDALEHARALLSEHSTDKETR